VRTVLACCVAVLAVCAPGFAQGKSQDHGNNPGKQNPPPSRSDLLKPAVAPAATVMGVTPFAWIDDASLVEPGSVSLAMSIVRWQGAGVSEVDVPVVDVSVGLAPRVHLTASVPRVVGSVDPAGAAGGVGTSYFSAKIAVVNGSTRAVKVSVAPTLELLGNGVLQSISAGERRAHFGLPASIEGSRGPARLYGSAGYFSRGIWFTGGGVGVRTTDKVYVSAGLSRSWRTNDAIDVPLADRARTDVTGSTAYALAPTVSVFGSIGRTIATLDENGAGTTVAAGVALSFTPAKK
jgi:hypothetical protein